MCIHLAQLGSMTPEQVQAWRWEKELDERNRPLSDEELDALFPQDGYKVINYFSIFNFSFKIDLGTSLWLSTYSYSSS